MKILVLGRKGQVGRELCRLASEYNHECIGLTHKQCDITNEKQCRRVIKKHMPDWVINAAAITNTEFNWHDELYYKAEKVNANFEFVSVCNELNIPIFHYSTDYMYQGTNYEPYQEYQTGGYVNPYAYTKANGENRIAFETKNYIILRIGWIYSHYQNNFLDTMLNLYKSFPKIDVVSDEVGCPTSATSVARATLSLLSIDEARGYVYNYCDNKPMSWYMFAIEILKMTKEWKPRLKCQIDPSLAMHWHSLINRPKYTVMDCTKISPYLEQPDFYESLRETLSLKLGKPKK